MKGKKIMFIPKKRRGFGLWIFFLIVLAFIILPTGTPEDLVTTVPLIAFLGMSMYINLVLALAIVIVLSFMVSSKEEF